MRAASLQGGVFVLRMMAVFEKCERLRHIGHLDIQRAMQRALRRSGLPVSYSKGYNPHILVTFASALSTGASGKRELMDVTLDQDVAPEAFLQAMNRALPPDMQLQSARVLDDRHPALMSQVVAADYTIRIMEEGAAEKLTACIEGFLQQESIPALRKTKSGERECDIRPLIHSLAAEGDCLRTVVTLTERESCKPDMLVKAMCSFAGVEVPRVMVVRNGLLGQDAAGNLIPLETL